MATIDRSVWPARLSTLLLAALAAASAVYWGLRWSEPVSMPPASDRGFGPQAIDTGRVAQLLGASATPVGDSESEPEVNPAGKYKLMGVIAQGRGNGLGSALIAMDDAPAKPYRVGDRLSDDLLLQSVSKRGAVLASSMQAPAAISLELPPLATIKPQ
ncbi:general secretion pathway protein C [Rhodoferax sp.]|uniref:general secretion pathway protein C n=1 Tax=Rhodoferax sp. TaxID=50421 RepID=UPI0025F850F1|nr:general secretion pathway protein C [Rhodoferax sp.]